MNYEMGGKYGKMASYTWWVMREMHVGKNEMRIKTKIKMLNTIKNICTWVKRRGRRGMHLGKNKLGIKTKIKILFGIKNVCTWAKKRARNKTKYMHVGVGGQTKYIFLHKGRKYQARKKNGSWATCIHKMCNLST